MNESETFIEIFGRVAENVHAAVDGLTADDLVWSPAPGTNSIGWLVWHLTRVQDDHVAELLDDEQLWTTGPWASRCGLAPDPANTDASMRVYQRRRRARSVSGRLSAMSRQSLSAPRDPLHHRRLGRQSAVHPPVAD